MYTLENVTLRPLVPSDLPKLYEWETDIETSVNGGHIRAISLEAFCEKKKEKFCTPQEDFVIFGIELSDEIVGYIMLALINREQRLAFTGIAVGDKSARRKGVAKNALRLLLDYGFHVENLDKICAEVYSFNELSHRLMQSVGFLQEGILRKHEVHNGERVDMHFYGMLKEEFNNRYETIFRVGR